MMSPPATTPAVSAAELSCYTAALARYLEGHHADPLARIARSVRLALRINPGNGLAAFSHHAVSLADLGGGYCLAYRGSTSPASLLAGLDRELAAAGGGLAVTYTAAMSWSVADPEDSAPHFVLVTGHEGERWRIEDPFSAQLPSGYQEPFTGWIPGSQLVSAMTPPGRLNPEHRVRLRYVFGHGTPLRPPHEFQWLARTAAEPSLALGPGWITQPSGVLENLSDFWSSLDDHPARVRHLDDVWASARHHAFRYSHLLGHEQLDEASAAVAETAREIWTELPMALRFAAESAARGRSRPSMIRGLFSRLSTVEQHTADILAAYGYGPPAKSAIPGQPARLGKESRQR
jgi:hypothetical protein